MKMQPYYYVTQITRWRIGLFMALTLLLSASGVLGQTVAGTVKGLVRDSTHNFAMPAATVSIYRVETAALVSYQLANNFGRFLFKDLPVGVPLRIIATNIGYASTRRDFMIPMETKEIDLNALNMDRQVLSLKEVTVAGTPPPVQMRGDTLEFNADAFKLDSNAVVGDMLKKLPGITIWNDGIITVNGKKINQLLVDGKVFFSSDGKIAIQNLSKDAVKKVQVYEDKSNPDPIETKTSMNIVLKKDKKDGYFGKIGGSLGTTKRYDANGMISYFSPKDQISLVGAINNVNKTADNINTLVQVNSFKGQGISDDYHSDFTRPGSIVFKAAGFTALHDFGRTKDKGIDTNNLKVEYFMTATKIAVDQHSNTAISLGKNDNLTQTVTNTSTSDQNGKVFHAEYDKKFDHLHLKAAYDFQHNASGNTNIMNNISSGDSLTEQSQSNDEQHNKTTNTIQAGKISLISERYKDFATYKNKSVDMNLDYWFNVNLLNDDRHRITDFTTNDPLEDEHFNRHYLTESTAAEHNISNSFNNILGLWKGGNPGLRIDVKNLLTYYHKTETDAVSDFYDTEAKYIPNTNLSTHIDTKVIDYKPGLDFSRTISHILSNRYRKVWNFDFFAQGQLYKFDNSSQKLFQILNRSYFYFIPTASIGYSNYQIGKFKEDFLLKYNTSVTYPGLQQLAPLVDDANVSFISYGNINLQPSYSHDMSFTYHYNNGDAKNPFLGEIGGSVGLTDNFITDSSFYDELGRSIYYPINVSGEHHFSSGGSVQKALKYNDHQLQLAGRSKFSYSQYSSSLNDIFYETKRYAWSVNTDLTYNYKGLSAQIGETFYNNRNSRIGLNEFNYRNWKTYGNVSFMMPKGLFFNSRIDYNKSMSTNTDNIYFTILNIDVGYRFLKGNNGEVKFSGLDLLHQNKNVFNNISNNSITTGTVNVLQQYFMITLAYYPRRFGLRKKED
jgi:hypothetical protein